MALPLLGVEEGAQALDVSWSLVPLRPLTGSLTMHISEPVSWRLGIAERPNETEMVKYPAMRSGPEIVIEPNGLNFHNLPLVFPNPGPPSL